jgi:hypothetical protein
MMFVARSSKKGIKVTKLFILLLLIISSMSLRAKVNLFNSEDIVKANLEMDISYFRRHKAELREKGIPGKFIVGDKSYAVEVLSRGHGSMDNEHPPFKLVFNKKENVGTLFEGIKKIKAFSSPDGESQSGENQVLSNYLTYKLLQKVSAYAFQTRMFSIKYVDTSGIIESFVSKTFLKEPNKNIAKRMNMTYVPFKHGGVNDPVAMDVKSSLHKPTVELITAFEFLAGNWDHAIPGLYSEMFKGTAIAEKNMKIIKDSSNIYYPIAYDFDMSGFIDRGICWWEIGYNLMLDGRSDHFKNIKNSCNNSFIKSHLSIDLNNYYYKNNFIKHYPFIKSKVIEWQRDYSKLLSTLASNYINNLNAYLDSIEIVLKTLKD